jgi:hypothetical protein
MTVFKTYRWPFRMIALLLVLTLAPSAPCAIEHAAAAPDWAGTVSWLSGADRRSAEEALALIRAGESGLALVRLDASEQRARGPLAMARLLSAWLLAETVYTVGALTPRSSSQA